MSMALHIIVVCHNVVQWRLVLNYMRTLPTQYYLESSGQPTCMETHPKLPLNHTLSVSK